VADDDESEAELPSAVMAAPDASARLGCDPTVTELVMVQVNVAEPTAPALSVAVTVTEQAHAVVGVPVTDPVEVLIDRPAGRPVADHEAMVAVDDESEAEPASVLIALPDTLL